MTQLETLRLADALIHRHGIESFEADSAAELRRLHADAEESEALRERLSALLKSTAIVLRGPEPELTSWGWHDLPERVAALKSQRDELLEALKALVEASDSDEWNGISTMKARAAIAKAQQ